MCSFPLPSAPNSQHFDWKKAGYSCPPLWGPRSAYTKILIAKKHPPDPKRRFLINAKNSNTSIPTHLPHQTLAASNPSNKRKVKIPTVPGKSPVLTKQAQPPVNTKSHKMAVPLPSPQITGKANTIVPQTAQSSATTVPSSPTKVRLPPPKSLPFFRLPIMEILKKDENGNYIARKEKILQALALKDFNGLVYFEEKTIKEYLDYIYIYDRPNAEDEKHIRKILTGSKDFKTDILDSLANHELTNLDSIRKKLIEGYLEYAYTNCFMSLDLQERKKENIIKIQAQLFNQGIDIDIVNTSDLINLSSPFLNDYPLFFNKIMSKLTEDIEKQTKERFLLPLCQNGISLISDFTENNDIKPANIEKIASFLETITTKKINHLPIINRIPFPDLKKIPSIFEKVSSSNTFKDQNKLIALIGTVSLINTIQGRMGDTNGNNNLTIREIYIDKKLEKRLLHKKDVGEILVKNLPNYQQVINRLDESNRKEFFDNICEILENKTFHKKILKQLANQFSEIQQFLKENPKATLNKLEKKNKQNSID